MRFGFLARATVALVAFSLACAGAAPQSPPPAAAIPTPPGPSSAIAAAALAPAAAETTLPSVAREPAGGTEGTVTETEKAATPPRRIVLADLPPFVGPRFHVRDVPARGHEAPKKRGRHARPYHPAPGIVVDVPHAQRASAADLQRAARNFGYWPFRRCYEEGLRRDQRLAGKIALDLSIAADGAVQRAAVVTTSVADESVVLCVAREAEHLPFAGPGVECSAKLDVTLWTGDEPVPLSPPAPRAGDLREALRASWPAVQRCYASSLAARPDVGGQMDLRFRVGADGEVVEVAEDGETRFVDADTTQCVLGVYRSAKLPPVHASGAQETRFTYALHLEAGPP